MLSLLIGLLDKPSFYDTDDLERNLVEVRYHHRFDILLSIFRRYLDSMLRRQSINSIVNEFFSYKHKIWQNEQEYRLIIPNYLSNIIDNIENQNGFNEKNADFINAKAELIEKRKKINVLHYTTRFELGHEQINLGAAPFCKSLPYPKKIYLGWAFKKYECDRCKTMTQEYNTIVNFCKSVQAKHGHTIELYSLDEKVDYKNNSFIVHKEYPLSNNL